MTDWNSMYSDQISNKPLAGTQRFPPKCIENTFQAIQSIFRSLEMNSKQHCKICLCSVILGELESFRNDKGLSIIFSKIFRCNFKFYERENFLIPLFIALSNSKILGFFLQEK